MKVCYYGAYDPHYARNRIIINGLRKNGVEVIEYYDESRFFIRTFKLLRKLLSLKEFDAIIVGYPGNLDVFSAKIISKLRKKPLIFDAFISVYDALVNEWGHAKRGSWKAGYCRFLDKYPCKLSDIVLLDTDQHIDYFCREFDIDKNKFRRIFIGANDNIFFPREKSKKKKDFIVLYYGWTTPLHGLHHIVKAAILLEPYEDIKFIVIGVGRFFREIKDTYKEKSKNIIFKDLVPLNEVPRYIADADVCLGIFGDTEKVDKVVPNKAYEALAMKKPLITVDSPAVRGVLTNHKNAILCKKSSSKAIVDSILLLKNDEKLRKEIAENGYSLFTERFRSEVLGRDVREVIMELLQLYSGK